MQPGQRRQSSNSLISSQAPTLVVSTLCQQCVCSYALCRLIEQDPMSRCRLVDAHQYFWLRALVDCQLEDV